MDIAELIERLERAQGPDRELDARIWEYLGLAPEYDNSKKPYGNWHYIGDGRYNFRDDTPFGHGARAPQYTSSIDAAMTLVPKGWMLWGLSDLMFDGVSGCTLIDCSGGEAIASGARTLPINICIAALKARSQVAGS